MYVFRGLFKQTFDDAYSIGYFKQSDWDMLSSLPLFQETNRKIFSLTHIYET